MRIPILTEYRRHRRDQQWKRGEDRITQLQRRLALTADEAAVLQALEAAPGIGLLGIAEVSSRALIVPSAAETAINALEERDLVAARESRGYTFYIFTGI